VDRKKITAAFDGGRITSDAGVVLLGQAERRCGLAGKLAAVIADPRNPLLITHPLGSFFRTRILAIDCGYEDADDLDHLRTNPAFRLACGRLPDTGEDLCWQPTMSRRENEVERRPHRFLLRQLRHAPASRHTRYRRYLRCRTWSSATLAVQRTL
jgi:hypothetical protein